MAVTADTASKQFTVGKLDAGMAILLTDDHHLIEFPSLLLPKGVSSGSIVNIAVHRNLPEEVAQRDKFWKLQETLLEEYGTKTPKPPVLRVKSVTQTSVLLEWEPLQLAGATLRSLSVFRDGVKLPLQIPLPLSPSSSVAPSPSGSSTMVRVSGLSVEHEYTLHVVLKTSAGVYESEKLKATTHSMEDLSGIRVFFGAVDDVEEQMTQEVEKEVEEEVETEEEVEAEGEEAERRDMRQEGEKKMVEEAKQAGEKQSGDVADEKSEEPRNDEENSKPKEARAAGDEADVDENDPVTDPEESEPSNDGDGTATEETDANGGTTSSSRSPPVGSKPKTIKHRTTKIVTRTVKSNTTVTVPRIVHLRSVLASLGALETPNGVTPETTHYVCDHPGGPDMDKALHANIPTVRPDWLMACAAQKGKKIPSTGDYYIGSPPVPTSTSGGGGVGGPNSSSSSFNVQPGKSTGSLVSK